MNKQILIKTTTSEIVNETKKKTVIFFDEIPLLYKNNHELMRLCLKHGKTCAFHDFSFRPAFTNINFGNTQCWMVFLTTNRQGQEFIINHEFK